MFDVMMTQEKIKERISELFALSEKELNARCAEIMPGVKIKGSKKGKLLFIIKYIIDNEFDLYEESLL